MMSQLSQSISDQLNNRFASLVQPIKDLAANWDIDIAENLSEYLEDLDHLRITVDGSKTQLNFAEAALLIQGSTAVYSKKVEYLHQLVLKSLEFITQKRSNKNSKDSSNSGKNFDANDRSYDEDFLLNFGELSEAKDLLLDHLIEEGENIDLPTKEISHHVANYSTDSVEGKTSSGVSRVSVSLLHTLLQDGAQNGGSSLKLLSSNCLDQSGALLLGSFRPSYFQPLSSTSAHLASDETNVSTTNAAAPPVSEAMDTQYYEHDDGVGHFFDDHMDYDAPSQNEPLSVPPFGLSGSAGTGAETGKGNDVVRLAPVLTSQQHQQHFSTPLSQLQQRLDPHSVLPGSRPVRRGRPFHVPKPDAVNTADEDPRYSVRRCFLLPTVMPDPAMQLLFPSSGVSVQDLRTKKSHLPESGLLDPCLLPLLQLKRKLQRARRMKALRHTRQEGKQQLHQEFSVLDVCTWETTRQQPPRQSLTAAEFDQNAYAPEYEDAHYGYEANDDYHDDYGADTVPVSQPSSFPNEEEDLAERTRQIDAALHMRSNENDELVYSYEDEALGNAGQSYEMLCRQYLEGFQRGADAFARETQLSTRVAAWTARLEPVLQRQEEAEVFDIHKYADTVLQDLATLSLHHVEPEAQIKEEVSFKDVVEGKSSGEVCRVFLACLQLANFGNVDVMPLQRGEVVDYMQPFHLRLLSAERMNKDLDSFQNTDANVVSAELEGSDETTTTKAKKATKKSAAKGRKTSTKERYKKLVIDDDVVDDHEDENEGFDDNDSSENVAVDEEVDYAHRKRGTKKTSTDAPPPRKRGLSQRDVNRDTAVGTQRIEV